MGRLTAQFTAAFSRDLKKLDKRHVDDVPLEEVIALILENTPRNSCRAASSAQHAHLVGVMGGQQ